MNLKNKNKNLEKKDTLIDSQTTKQTHPLFRQVF